MQRTVHGRWLALPPSTSSADGEPVNTVVNVMLTGSNTKIGQIQPSEPQPKKKKQPDAAPVSQ